MIISSGDILSYSLVELFYKYFNNCTLLNLYGSSETSGDFLFYNCNNYKQIMNIIPLGEPLDDSIIIKLFDDNYNEIIKDNQNGHLY